MLIEYTSDANKPAAVIIENKINAGDRKSQLKKYIGCMKKEGYTNLGKDLFAAYLTLTGDEPSEYSIGGEVRKHIIAASYKERECQHRS